VAAFAEIANQMTSADGPALALKPLLTVAVGCWWGNPVQETRDLVVAAAQRLQTAQDDPVLIAVLACADPVGQGALVIDRISRMTPDASGDPAALHLIGLAATAVWAFDLSWGFLAAAVEGLREQGRVGLLALLPRPAAAQLRPLASPPATRRRVARAAQGGTGQLRCPGL
jgi:hypothetical protein